MGTGIADRIYIIMGFICLDLTFSGFPSVTKCELTPDNKTGSMTTYTDGIFPQHTLNTKGCVIPNLFYSDQAKKNLTHFPDNMRICVNSYNRLLNNNLTHIWVVDSNVPYYNATNNELFRCCYKAFHLAATGDADDQGKKQTIQYEDCLLFNDSIVIYHEFIRVFCYYNTSIIYNQLFVFVIDKPQMRTGNETSSLDDIPEPAPIETETLELPTNNSFNVILLGMSSISRRNFRRTMPKTLNVLKDKDTVDFFGYNRYADTKFNNILPALLGKTFGEKNKRCKLQGKNSTEEKKDCLFIWDRFKRRGYFTALAEDATKSSISSLFNYSPTDYYFNPFIIESEQDNKKNHPDFCTGDKYTYKIMIDYVEQLCKSLRTSKLFGMFWQSSLSTLGFNYPIATDSDYEMLLQNLNKNGYLNRTVLIILSDRGSRYGSSRENYLEDRLPLLKLVLPPSFRYNYRIAYNNLRQNSDRLVTTFDLHATLMDLASIEAIRDEEILIRNEEKFASNRAISLFLVIPDNRTCSMAHISKEQCTCYKRESLSNLSGLTAKYAANKIIPEINKIIAPYPQCRRLALRRLLKMSKYSATYMKENRWMEYLVRVQANPEGIFDAVLRYDNKWQFVSLINRIDYDGLKSFCVDDPFVKIYCICKPKPVMERIIPLPLLT